MTTKCIAFQLRRHLRQICSTIQVITMLAYGGTVLGQEGSSALPAHGQPPILNPGSTYRVDEGRVDHYLDGNWTRHVHTIHRGIAKHQSNLALNEEGIRAAIREAHVGIRYVVRQEHGVTTIFLNKDGMALRSQTLTRIDSSEEVRVAVAELTAELGFNIGQDVTVYSATYDGAGHRSGSDRHAQMFADILLPGEPRERIFVRGHLVFPVVEETGVRDVSE